MNDNIFELQEQKKITSSVYLQNSFIEACYKASLIQQKIISYVAYYYKLHQTSNIKVSFVELKKMTGIKANYISIRKNLEAIKELEVICDIYNPTLENFDKLAFKIMPTTLSNSKACYATITLNPLFTEMLEYNSSLRTPYTIYNLENVKNVKSSDSIKLYQLLKQYKPRFRTTRTFSFNDLKIMLGYSKYDKKNDSIVHLKYKSFGAFKQKVLERAKIELLEYCDVCFTYETKKNHQRKVEKIIFTIFVNENVQLEFDWEEDKKDIINRYSEKELYLENIYSEWKLKYDFSFHNEFLNIISRIPFEDLKNFVYGLEYDLENTTIKKSKAALIGSVLKNNNKIEQCRLKGFQLIENERLIELKNEKCREIAEDNEKLLKQELNEFDLKNLQTWNDFMPIQQKYLLKQFDEKYQKHKSHPNFDERYVHQIKNPNDLTPDDLAQLIHLTNDILYPEWENIDWKQLKV